MILLALLAAPVMAEGLEVGLGLRDSMSDAGPDGPRVVARMPLAAGVSVEANLFYRPWGEEKDVSGLDQTLVYIAHGSSGEGYEFRQPVSADVWEAVVLADWDFGGRSFTADVHGGPHLCAGLGARGQRRGFAIYDDEAAGEVPVAYVPDESSVLPTGVLGIGMDLWFGGVAGVRLGFLHRLSVQGDPQYSSDEPSEGSSVVNDRTWTLDVLVRL